MKRKKMNMKKFGLLMVALPVMGVLSGTLAAGREYAPRANYGAKFEPQDTILHGAGQTYSTEPLNHAFETYGTLLGDDRYPVVFMDYNSITSPQSFYDTLRVRLDAIQADTGKYVVPQIGLYIPSAAGSTPSAAQLEQLSSGLKSLNRPVFLRIGYEFNGVWYDPMYNPTDFVNYYKAIVDKLRADDAPVANVWCPYPGYSSYYGSWNYLSGFYPGDEYVDWWGMDTFSSSDLIAQASLQFLSQADAHNKPVMIGEATPRYVGADDEPDWQTWFEPYFDMIADNPGIKAMTYIDWDWSQSQWSDWGDARLETGNSTVRNRYLAEMSNPIYAHADSHIPTWAVPEPGALALLFWGIAAIATSGIRRYLAF